LLLNKANFSEKGNKIYKQKFLRNLDKATLLSGKEKKKVDDLINLIDDEHDDKMLEEDRAINLGGEEYIAELARAKF
jgi:Mg2+/Co2+ transporter CorC